MSKRSGDTTENTDNSKLAKADGSEELIRELSVEHGVSIEVSRLIFQAGQSFGNLPQLSSTPSHSTPLEEDMTPKIETSSKAPFAFNKAITVDMLRSIQAQFAADRDWDQFHTPRNLALALVGEVGELCEIFQWKGEVEVGCPTFKEEEIEHVGQELSDVFLYLIRLSEKCRIDLPSAVLEKITLNAIKYPATDVRGSSMKYNEYNK